MSTATKTKDSGIAAWSLEGELILNCNCTVFCPCVVSLGQHPPTEGYCQAWSGIRIDKGSIGDLEKLAVSQWEFVMALCASDVVGH